jgi:hypothetical protein
MFYFFNPRIKVNLDWTEECIEQTVELVRRNVLTQMDGRDLSRILALESPNDTHCYTASLEQGAIYGPRHTTANFNRPTFCSELKQKYGRDIQFRQIILDYFWIPNGTWQRSHWSKTFFNTTLPNFVKENLLDFHPGLHDEEDDAFSCSGKGGGVVYLPFCLHCVQQIIGSMDILRQYYTVEFVYTEDLDQHALWAATSTIDPDVMQNWLGKALNQEDLYCTITLREVLGSTIDPNVTMDELLNLLRHIENFKNVRMIKLKALKKFNPMFIKQKQKACIGIDIGGFIGLANDPSSVQNGFDQHFKRKMKKASASSRNNEIAMKDDHVVESSNDSDWDVNKENEIEAATTDDNDTYSGVTFKVGNNQSSSDIKPIFGEKDVNIKITIIGGEIVSKLSEEYSSDHCSIEMKKDRGIKVQMPLVKIGKQHQQKRRSVKYGYMTSKTHHLHPKCEFEIKEKVYAYDKDELYPATVMKIRYFSNGREEKSNEAATQENSLYALLPCSNIDSRISTVGEEKSIVAVEPMEPQCSKKDDGISIVPGGKTINVEVNQNEPQLRRCPKIDDTKSLIKGEISVSVEVHRDELKIPLCAQSEGSITPVRSNESMCIETQHNEPQSSIIQQVYRSAVKEMDFLSIGQDEISVGVKLHRDELKDPQGAKVDGTMANTLDNESMDIEQNDPQSSQCSQRDDVISTVQDGQPINAESKSKHNEHEVSQDNVIEFNQGVQYEYFIHFNGWKKSQDKWCDQSKVLKDNKKSEELFSATLHRYEKVDFRGKKNLFKRKRGYT